MPAPCTLHPAPCQGVDLKCLSTGDEHVGPNRFQLSNSIAPYDPKNPPMVVSLDCHMDKPTEFVAGTTHCDIWEVGFTV